MSRRAWALAAVLAGALAVPAAAGAPAGETDQRALRFLTVPVEGGGSIGLPYRGTPPRGVTATRTPGPPSASASSEPSPDVAPPPTDDGPGPASESARFPADAAATAGVISSLAGGRCDGYPAREATISPAHMAYDRAGRLYWVELATQGAGAHAEGSSLVRMLDTAGRVRTIGPVFGPAEGRSYRQDVPATSLVSIVPDEEGGVYLNAAYGQPRAAHQVPGDLPTGNQLIHLRASGERELVVGGLPSPTGVVLPTHGEGEPVTRASLTEVQGWTFDGAGNVYLADAIAGGFFGTRIRFANRSAKTVTFYPGTAYELDVEPGVIRTIAGTGRDDVDNGAGYAILPAVPARTSNYYQIPRLTLHVVDGAPVLYFINTRWGGWQAPAGSKPSLVHALNLFSPAPVVVNGQSVPLGYTTVVAGNVSQPAGYSGDGGPATAAQFGFQVDQLNGDFYVAPDGSLVIADTANHRIRVVSPLGIVTTVAGTGVPGFNAEGAAAPLTSMWQPLGVAPDPQGRTVFADFANSRIRRIEPDGRVVTIAGRGPTPCGDGHLATGRTVHEGAYFGDIADTAYDSQGRLYVADAAFKTIRRILPSGRIDATIGQVSRCAGRIRAVTDVVVAALAACPTVGAQADGPLAQLRFASPQHLRVDSYDNLVVSDLDRLVYVNLRRTPVSVLGITVPALAATTLRTFGGRVVHVEVEVPGGLVPDGFPPLPVGGGSTTLEADLLFPLGDVALDADGTAYVSDPLADVVYRLTTCSDVRVVAGTGTAPAFGGQGDGGPATSASLVPHDLEIDRTGRVLYVVDASANGRAQAGSASYGSRVRAVNLDRARAREAYGVEVAPLEIETVAGGARCSDIGPGCSFGYGGQARDAALGPYVRIARAADASMYVADTNTHRIGVVFADGRYYGVAGSAPEKPDGAWYFGSKEPSYPRGYLGDGGRALDAWFSWTPGSGDVPDAALTLDPAGGLVVADDVGRLRRIDDVARAQLRTGAAVPGLPAAGAGFSPMLVATGPAPAGDLRSTVSRPDLAETATGPVLVAGAGAGRGCATWQVRRDADGKGKDTIAPDGDGRVAAFPLGGGDCAMTRLGGGLGLVTPARTRDAGAATDEIALLTGTAAAPGGTWAPGVVADTARAGATDLGPAAIAAAGTGALVAYRTADSGLAVATGGVAAATGVRGVRLVGDVVVDRGSTYVGIVSHGLREGAVQVAVAAGPVGPWTTEQVRVVDATSMHRLTAPSLAVDRAGRLYATWSDARTVYVAYRVAPGRWSAPTAVSALFAGTLPTIAAGEPGRVAVAFYASGRPRSDATDPYAFWYVATAVTRDATAATPRFDVRLATATDTLRGALCHQTCADRDEVAAAQQSAATCLLGGRCPVLDAALGRSVSPGRARVRISDQGDVGIAFGVDAALTGDGLAGGVGYARSCQDLGLLAGARITRCAATREAAPVRRPPPGGPGGAPEPPPLPSVGPCSPRPPAYAPAPAPAPQAAAEPEAPVTPPRDLRPLVGAPIVVPGAPPELSFPAGTAPAANAQGQNSQAQQTQQGQVSEVNPVAGSAMQDEEQVEVSHEYAMSRLPDPMLAVSAAMLAGLAMGYERRRRTAPARARTSAGPPRPWL